MKCSGVEIRDSIEAASKEAREVFTEAVNSAVDEAVSKVWAESELHRRRDIKEAVRVSKDKCHRRKSR